MAPERGSPLATWPRRLLDALQYAVAVLVLTTVVLGALSGVIGAGALGIKWGLFIWGTLVLGYASFLLWRGSRARGLAARGIIRRFRGSEQSPDEPTDRPLAPVSPPGRSQGDPTAFQRIVRRLPPAAWYPIRPRDRLSDGMRLLLASGLMFGLSIVLEVVFGVGIGL